MALLVNDHGYPLNGATGLVGNLRSESGVLPNRIEGSLPAISMRAQNFAREVTDFTAEQVMNRNRALRQGPRRPGIGLAQWTFASRRRGLFEHRFEGRHQGADIPLDMDAQVDYLVTELGARYAGVDRVLSATGVTLNDASDDVAYRFEIPGSILDADRRRLPRTDPAVQRIFDRRRRASRGALRAYREAHPEIAEGIQAGEAVDYLSGGEWDVQEDLNRPLESTLAITSVFGPLSLEAVESAIEQLKSAAERTQAAPPLRDERSEAIPIDEEAASADRFVRWFQQALARLGGLAAGAGAIPVGPAATGIAVCAGLTSPEVIDRFAFGSANLLRAHLPQVVRTARCIVASLGSVGPIDTLRVVGHTDSSGSQASNLVLGRHRAETVKQELLRTIDRLLPGTARPTFIEVSSEGEARTLPDPAMSRRVEVFMTLPAQPSVSPPMRIRLRRNVVDLSAAERTALSDAINELKHHAFIDKVWGDWQAAHPGLEYLPATEQRRSGKSPASGRSAAKVGIGAARDLTRTRSELVAENALLRQQVIVLRRGIRRPRVHRHDRLLLLILARLYRRLRDALHIVNPETLLRWHRDLFKFLWRRRSRPGGPADAPRRGSRPLQRDPLSHRRLGHPTAAGGHTVLLRAEVAHSGQRREVRKAVCRRGRGH